MAYIAFSPRQFVKAEKMRLNGQLRTFCSLLATLVH